MPRPASGPLPSGGSGSSTPTSEPASEETTGGEGTSSSAPLRSGGSSPAASEEGTEGSSSTGAVPAGSEAAAEGTKGGAGPEEEADEEKDAEEEGTDASAASPRPGALPPGEARRSVVRFVLFFLAFMGILMIADSQTRNEVAAALGYLLAPAFGFNGQHILLTMFLVAAVEMGCSALAYHVTTDWVLTAKVQKDNAAIRPIYNKALRAGKKEQLAALKPHMDQLNITQSQVTINQLKGMVITWVLLIAMYTWVGLFIFSQCPGANIGSFSSAYVVDSPISIWGNGTGGHGPYTLSWWASQSSGVVVNGPTGTGDDQWVFTPTVPGEYTITLEVTDARSNQVVVNNAAAPLQVVGSSQAAPPAAASARTPALVGSTAPAVTTGIPPGATPAGCSPGSSVDFFGARTNLLSDVGPFPVWFFAFSLYTLPLNLLFRRYLKHSALSQHLGRIPPEEAAPPASGSGGATT